MKQCAVIILFACLFSFVRLAAAYEKETHADISRTAAESSMLNVVGNDVLRNLGLNYPIQEKVKQVFPNSKGENKSVLELIRDGTRFEDNNIRPANHFYNPLTGQGIAGFKPSPDWALEDKSDVEGQDFSYKHARQYFYEALTATSPTDRDSDFGKTFETLGHVIHHLQDMAQPQHVRNDIHCDAIFPCLIPGALIGKYNPSLYEKYTQSKGGDLRFDGYAPLYTDSASSTIFSAPRKLWRTSPEGQADISQGMGLAEYTNRNFISSGTNFDKPGLFPSPVFDPANKKEEDIKTLIPGTDLSGAVVFYGNTVEDKFRGESLTNPRASSESIFDEELKKAGRQPVFTLNRFNFNAAHEFLIPRAVAYSAGLIDYFFRGTLEAEDVTFTDTGISLRVKNAVDPTKTPAWSNEILYAKNSNGSAGSLVVAFDYKDSADKTQYGVSNVVALRTSDNLGPGQVSADPYDFSLTLPPDAKDIHYRLVFRGRLGQEEDAVAVGPADPISGFVFNSSYIPVDGITGSRVIYQQGDRWRLTDQQNRVAGNIDWKGWYRNGKPTKVLSWVGPSSRYFPKTYDPKVSGYSSPVDTKIYQNGEIFAAGPPVLGAALYRDSIGKEWLVVISQDALADVVYRRPNIKNNSPAGWQQIGRFYRDPTLLNTANTPWFFNGSGTEAQTIRSGYKTGDPKVRLFRLKISITDNNATFSNEGNLDDDANVGAYTASKGCNAEQPIAGFCAADCSGGWTENTLSESQETVQREWSGSSIIAVDYIEDTPIFATYSTVTNDTYNSKIAWESSYTAVCNGRRSSGACNINSSWETRNTRHFEKNYSMVEKISISGFGDIIMGSTTGKLQLNATKTDVTGLPTILDKSGGGNFEYTTSRLRYLDLRYGLYSLRSETKESSGQATNVQVDFFGGPFSVPDGVFLPRKTTIKQVTGYGGKLPVHQIELPEDIVIYPLEDTPLVSECNSTVTNPGSASRPIFMDPGVLFSGGTWGVDSNKNLFLSESKLDKDMRGVGAFNYLTGAVGEDPGSVIPTAPQSIYFYDKIGVVK